MDQFLFEKLRNTGASVSRDLSAKAQINNPWVLENMTPTTLHLFSTKYGSGRCNLDPLIDLKAFETLRVPPDRIKEGDTIYAYIKKGNSMIPFMEKYVCREFRKHIRLGAITYSSGDGRNATVASNWDMRGVWIHNKLAVPLNIYYKGNLAAQVFGDMNSDYMGGGGSSIYFDNDREGLNFMDEITFSYAIDGRNQVRYTTAVLNDVQCTSMYVGVISGGWWGNTNDNAVYRVDKPCFTGVVRFEPTAEQYKTKATWGMC